MNRGLTAILIVFAALALLFNWASPLFENSDEFFHFPFIRHLADNGFRLPVQSGDNLQDWRQEGSQPPLYHLASAILILPFDTDDYAETRRINPHAQIGVVGESNINHVLHPLDRSQEFTGGTALAVRVVRLFSTVLAGIVVAATFYLTRAAFPELPGWVALLAASLVAFNPMLLFVASSINNDNLANAMIASVLAILASQFRREDLPSPRVLLLVGTLLGVGMLSKLSTGPFLLIVGYLWLGLALKHRNFAYMFKWGVAALVPLLLISAWWYIRNYDLYGDPTGLNVFLDIVGRRSIDLTAEQLWSEREGFVRSFWGLYGGLTVDMADWVYVVFNVLAGVSALGFVVFVAKHWRRIDFPQSALLLWSALSFIFLVRWTSLTWASQGRLWFVALPALAVIGAVGVYQVCKLVRVDATGMDACGIRPGDCGACALRLDTSRLCSARTGSYQRGSGQAAAAFDLCRPRKSQSEHFDGLSGIPRRDTGRGTRDRAFSVLHTFSGFEPKLVGVCASGQRVGHHSGAGGLHAGRRRPANV